jgi:hypothetical protein
MGGTQSIESRYIPRTPKVPLVLSPDIQLHKRQLEFIRCACNTWFTVSITTYDTYCVYTLHLEREILDICTIDIYAFNIYGNESYIVRLNDYNGELSTLNSTAPAHTHTYEFRDIMMWYTSYPYKKLDTMREVLEEIFKICGNAADGAYDANGTFGASFLL